MHVKLLMASAEDEKIFLRAAVDAIPKVAEIVCGCSPEDQSGALDAAERRFVKSARDYGLLKSLPVSAIMRLLRRHVKARQTSEAKLPALLSDAGTKKGADPHYSVMTLKEIKALPVHELARGDCLLLLWTTGWAIATGQAQEVARAWGFKPISEIVWLKRGPHRHRLSRADHARADLGLHSGNPTHKPFPSTFDGIAISGRRGTMAARWNSSRAPESPRSLMRSRSRVPAKSWRSSRPSSPPEGLTGSNLGAPRCRGAFVCAPSFASTFEVEIPFVSRLRRVTCAVRAEDLTRRFLALRLKEQRR